MNQTRHLTSRTDFVNGLLGCSRGAIAGFVAAEISLIATASAALAFGLLALASVFLESLVMRLFA